MPLLSWLPLPQPACAARLRVAGDRRRRRASVSAGARRAKLSMLHGLVTTDQLFPFQPSGRHARCNPTEDMLESVAGYAQPQPPLGEQGSYRHPRRTRRADVPRLGTCAETKQRVFAPAAFGHGRPFTRKLGGRRWETDCGTRDKGEMGVNRR